MIRRELNALNDILLNFKRDKKKLDPEVAYKLMCIDNAISAECYKTVQKENELLMQYGMKNEDNQLKINENGDYVFTPENARIVNAELRKFASEEVAITLPKIKIECFRPLKLDLNEISALMPILEE